MALIETLKERWAQLGAAPRICLALLGLGLVAGAGARPALAVAKNIASTRNLRLAEQALAKNEPAAARNHCLAVLQWFPERIEAIRMILLATDALGDPLRSQLAAILLQHPDHSRADKQMAFAVIARNSPLGVVGAIWNDLSAAEKADPVNLDAFGRRLLAEGKPEQVAMLLPGLDLQNPDDLTGSLVVDMLRTKGGDEAWKEIQRLIKNRASTAVATGSPIPDWCLTAWELAPQNLLDPSAADLLRNDDSQRPRMILRRMRQGAVPIDSSEPEIQQWLAHTDPENRLPLARFLSHCGLRKEAVRLLENGAPLKLDEYEWLREARIHLLEWPELKRFLKSPAASHLPQHLIQADLATACSQLRQSDESGVAWREAMRLAGSGSQDSRLTDLSRRVRPWLPDRSNEALLAAVGSQVEALPLFNDIHELVVFLHQTGREKDLLDVLRKFQSLEPGNPAARVSFAYMALLLGETSAADTLKLMAPVIDHLPSAPQPRIIAVIAALLDNNRTEARNWVARDTVDWTGSEPLHQWIITLAETGTPPASPATSKPPLLPCEELLIRTLTRLYSPAGSR